jgi:H+-translocating diphosphatase
MRRGTSVTAPDFRRRPVAADVEDGGADLEGGGTSTPHFLLAPSSGGAGGGGSFQRSSSLDIGSPGSGGGGGVIADYDYSVDHSQAKVVRKHHAHHRSVHGKHGGGFLLQGPSNLGYVAVLLLGATCLVCPFVPLTWSILTIVSSACLFGGIASLWLSRSVLQCDEGTPEMRAVSDPIREGAEGFLKVQYTAIAKFAVPLAILIVLSYQLRPEVAEGKPKGVAILGNLALGIIAAVGFVFGAVCSAVSGYLAMWVAAQSNIRVASASRRTYGEALVVCFRGGAFSAVLNLTMCIAGVTALYTILHTLYASTGIIKATEVPMLLVGYGFGASFVALFMQLGGGIYTKAADVGADLTSKVEQSIPEDDPRNPATIADLVGDMVGDCVGSSADVFESVAAEIIGAMILGSTLANESGMSHDHAAKFVFFPLIVHAMDIIVSSVGIAFVGITRDSADSDPMKALQKGYTVALSLSVAGFYVITSWLLESPHHPGSGLKFFFCGIVGMLCAYIIVLSTQYYTDYAYGPVQSIAEASTTGHGTNIIVGISVGLKATFIPTITVAIAVLTAYHLGASTGIGSGRNAGLFGTAVATMGMLSNAVYILSMNNFGPIADNAGGITEMSMQPEKVRDVTDRLDAAGNVTKAVTKGYSIGSASMACFLLFGAFMDEFSEFSGLPFVSVNIATPEVLIGGLIGSMIIFYFTGLTISAVGRTAHDVVKEVRRQFKENPDIMTYKAKPDYQRCVSLVTEAALREMQFPGLLCVVTPIVVGVTFRYVGEQTNRPLLGAEVLASYLMFATVTGILMALFMDTAGGAWDNAKKYIELGNFGGKKSEAHKASVTGDTVGDPFKDTAG